MSAANRVAYHEAAHVLVSRLAGRPVHSVTLTLDGGGATRLGALHPDASTEEIEQQLVMVLAGKAAEEYAPSSPFPLRRTWKDTDEPWLTAAEDEALHVQDELRQEEHPNDEDIIAQYEERIGTEAVERARALADELVMREHHIGRLDLLATAFADPTTPEQRTDRCRVGRREWTWPIHGLTTRS